MRGPVAGPVNVRPLQVCASRLPGVRFHSREPYAMIMLEKRLIRMAKNEKTSPAIATIASKGLKTPSKLTTAQIKKLAGSALTQAADKKK